MSSTSWLAFTPRDTVFVRDGRSFDAAADALAETVRPGPTTIAGAVGAAFGVEPAPRCAGRCWPDAGAGRLGAVLPGARGPGRHGGRAAPGVPARPEEPRPGRPT